jgi:hypothetical protein
VTVATALNPMLWPKDVKVLLNNRLEELLSHKQSVMEPSVSNIAAVSSAIGSLGDNINQVQAWEAAIETILLVISNITKNPGVPRYYKINAVNPNFRRRVGSVHGGLEILIGVGFREEEGGTLIMPIDKDISDLKARELELQVGLDLVRSRISELKSSTVSFLEKGKTAVSEKDKKLSKVAKETKEDVKKSKVEDEKSPRSPSKKAKEDDEIMSPKSKVKQDCRYHAKTDMHQFFF